MVCVDVEDKVCALPAFLFHWKGRVLVVGCREVDMLRGEISNRGLEGFDVLEGSVSDHEFLFEE